MGHVVSAAVPPEQALDLVLTDLDGDPARAGVAATERLSVASSNEMSVPCVWRGRRRSAPRTACRNRGA